MNRHGPLAAPDANRLDRLELALIAGRIDRRGFLRAAAAAGLAASSLQVLADELDAIRANQAERAARLRSCVKIKYPIFIGCDMNSECNARPVFSRSNRSTDHFRL